MTTARRALFPLLKYSADRRTLAFIAVYTVLVAAGFALWDVLAWWQHGLLMGATCLFAFFNAVIVHNIVHCPVFRHKPLNRWFQYVVSVAYGHPVSAFVRGHNLSHHMHTQTRKDVMRTSKARFKWHLLNQLLYFFVIIPDINQANQSYARKMRTERPEWFWQFVREWIAVFAVMGLLLVINWQAFIVYFLLPHGYGAWGIVGINFIQHDGTDRDHAFNHSRNFVGKTINWWAFNNGFHGLHHHKPRMHWSLLPEVHAAEVAPYIDPRLDQTSLIAYCWTTYIWPGKRTTFDGKPFFPEPAGEDDNWIPGRNETPEGVSLGAVA